MLLPLVAAVTLSPSDIDVAFSARYYFEGKKKSYPHLYVCRHDGTHRQQLTFGTMSTMSQAWLDHNHLAYVEVQEKQGPYRPTDSWKARVVVIDLKTKRKRTLFNGKVNPDWTTINQDTMTINLNDKDYKISVDRVTVLPKTPDTYDQFGGSTGDTGDPRSKAQIATTASSPAYTLYWTQAEGDDLKDATNGLQITSQGITKHFTVKLGTIQRAKPVGQNELYVDSAPWYQKLNCTNFLYRLDFAKGTSTLLVTDAGRLEVDIKQNLWLGCQTESQKLLKLKDGRQVYVQFLYAGNWKEGKRWRIADGLVCVYDYHLRPTK
jgi:hypothetical protein